MAPSPIAPSANHCRAGPQRLGAQRQVSHVQTGVVGVANRRTYRLGVAAPRLVGKWCCVAG